MKRYLSLFVITLVLLSTTFSATAHGAEQQNSSDCETIMRGRIQVTKGEELLRAHIKCSQDLFEEHIKWSEQLFEEHVKWVRGLSDATAPGRETPSDADVRSDETITPESDADEAGADDAAASEQPSESTDEILHESRNWIEQHIRASGDRLQSHIKRASTLFEDADGKK